MKAYLMRTSILALVLISSAQLSASFEQASTLVRAIRIKYCGPALTISKLSSEAVIFTPPGNFTYTITVENNSLVDVVNAAFTDTLPGTISFVPSGSSVSNGATLSAVGQTVSASLGTIPAQSSVTITLNVIALSASVTVVENTATVTSSNASPVSDTSLTIVLTT